ncbi:hypothetical protein [Parageobacillus toebii]|uniref:hypothetical protein n=1 Tax=Parageobacillus toebii TaxID=153151 RepID=UPI002814E6FB|nr:hypothetical protein [Parageobacillus toebii]WMT18172.1 hypothetical protein RFB12_12705 [Parageobacillus toebii]
MKHCIYLKGTEPTLSFNSREHIFPAGIGGIQMLPKGYVSDQFNNSFSKIEMDFMRNSLALPRQFYGPGKRGSLLQKKATKSKISIIENINNPKDITFGYISLGQPHNIPQIKININGTCTFIADKSAPNYMEQLYDFIAALETFNGQYILYEDDRFSDEEMILGYYDKKWYLGLKNHDLTLKVSEFIQKILEQRPFEKQKVNHDMFQPKVSQKLYFDMNNYFRTCAKIVFNYLAYVKGLDFVLNSCFDPIRNWIVNGGENEFSQLIQKEDDEKGLNGLPFPDSAHKIIITKIKNRLFGYVSFYGSSFETMTVLADSFSGTFEIEGYICDWKNRKEYTLVEFLQSLHNR